MVNHKKCNLIAKKFCQTAGKNPLSYHLVIIMTHLKKESKNFFKNFLIRGKRRGTVIATLSGAKGKQSRFFAVWMGLLRPAPLSVTEVVF